MHTSNPISFTQKVVSSGILSLLMFLSFSLCAQTPVIYLPLNGNTNDISGNNLNGTNNNATLTADRFNNPNAAYYFNGTNASIGIPYSGKFNFAPAGQFSISLWLQPAMANSISALFVKSPYNSNFYLSNWDYGLYLLNNKGMSGYANNNFLVATTTMVAASCWYHLVVTYNNGVWKLYLNGKLEASNNSQTYKILQSTGGISLGKKGDADGDFFNGKLDDVRLYDIALTPAQVKKTICFAGNDTTICNSDSAQLTGQGLGTPLWSPSTGLSNPNILNPKAAPGSNQTYILTLSDGGTCIVSDTVAISLTTVSVNLGPDQFICEGDSFIFNNTMPGNYDWTPIYAINNNKIPNPTVHPLVSASYIVKVTNGNCVARDTIHFDVTNIRADAGTDKTICIGDTVQLNGTTVGSPGWTPVSYISDPLVANPYVFPPSTRNYVLTSIATTCTRRDTVLVTVINQVPTFAGTDTAICEGSSFQLNGSYGTAGDNAEWLTTYAISNPFINNPFISPSVDTSYIFRAGFGAGCYGYDTVNIKLTSYPVVDAGPDIRYCFDGIGQVNAAITNFDSMYWLPGQGLFNTGAIATAVSGNTSMKYVLVALNKGCEQRDSFYLLVQPKLSTAFKATPPGAIAPAGISFTNQSANGKFYLWDFGDGGGGNETDPKHTYITPGIYKVKLVSRDSLGCIDSAFLDVQLFLKPYLYIPTAFTVNGDGLNDNFAIIYNAEAFSYLKYSIYDRWGELLYQTAMPGGKWWDGTYKGLSCQGDVYVFKLDAEDLTGKVYSNSGNVTLIR